jgi:hypothetical protein
MKCRVGGLALVLVGIAIKRLHPWKKEHAYFTRKRSTQRIKNTYKEVVKSKGVHLINGLVCKNMGETYRAAQALGGGTLYVNAIKRQNPQHSNHACTNSALWEMAASLLLLKFPAYRLLALFCPVIKVVWEHVELQKAKRPGHRRHSPTIPEMRKKHGYQRRG